MFIIFRIDSVVRHGMESNSVGKSHVYGASVAESNHLCGPILCDPVPSSAARLVCAFTTLKNGYKLSLPACGKTYRVYFRTRFTAFYHLFDSQWLVINKNKSVLVESLNETS